MKKGGYSVGSGASDMITEIEEFVTAEIKGLFSELREVAI
jgi:hypothetical protein